jgi:hypothetical protein
MEDYVRLFETLLERVADYFKTTVELVKLKAVEKITDLISSLIPHVFIIGILIFAFLFLNVGLALWLGDIFGNLYLGFLAVGAFHGILAIVFRLFFYKGLKRVFGRKLINKLLK